MAQFSSLCIFLIFVGYSSGAKILAEPSEISGGEETEVTANGDPRFGFSQPYIPLDGIITNFNGTSLGNATIPVNFSPFATSALLAKKGLLAVLTLIKAILPQALLAVIFVISVIVVIGYLFGLLTDWGSPLLVRGENIFEPDIYRRNAFENDHNKFRPVLQGIDDHKYKYSQVSQD
ncbi:unnamed protein product [Allacma fusca]|uniref:Uncharacterized protein n=1 Tax=Allacma fusca TaxID=39272 RepID=A0A8J2JGP8_9HEXA|nr:unnamed protein product [Allacma fusca]